MDKIYTVGETVFDIIFKNGVPVSGNPGGAMLNTAISLARLNLNPALIGDVADDNTGKLILEFLQKNNVSTQYVSVYKNSKSRLALAFLDENNNADYDFYKIRKCEKSKLLFPSKIENDIVLFGSFYSIKKEVFDEVTTFIENANDSIIIYDPNFRKAHLSCLKESLPMIISNIKNASIVKGSDEDFKYIFDVSSAEETARILSDINPNCLLIYTAAQSGVDVCLKGQLSHFDVPKINPVSTVGAGDTFNAGLIYGLKKHKLRKSDIRNMGNRVISDLVSNAVKFAQNVCMGTDNYISPSFAESVNSDQLSVTSYQ